MKILEVINIGYPAGGAEVSTRLIRDELRKRGHEVKVFSSDLKGENMFSDYDFKLISASSAFKFLQYIFYWHSYFRMRKIIREFKPDLIHFHTTAFFSPSVLFATGQIPSLMTIHGPEDFTLSLIPWRIPASEYKTDVYNLKDLTTRGKFRFYYMYLFQRPMYLLGLKKVIVFLAPSMYMAAAIQTDVPKNKIVQIYNGINLPLSQPLPNNKRVLYVGRLEKVKGVEYLIRSFAEVVRSVPDAQLRIVGDGAQRAELEQLASTLQLDGHIEFAGWVKAEEVVNEYRDSVVLVIPSIWPENLPTVCIEALAVGRAIVGTRVGGIPELIQHGETGYIVPKEDSKGITDALVKLLSNRELLTQMGKAAAESSKRFGTDHFIDQIEDVYKKLV